MPLKFEVSELFPSMIIGLGGTGKKVLTGVRAYLEKRIGEVPTNRIRLLSLDIDPQIEIARADSKEVTLKDNEKINLGGVPLEDIRKLVDKGLYPELESWFDKDMVNVERVLVKAAHQIRQAGRIAFFWHLSSSITTSKNVAKIIKDNFDSLIDIYHSDVTKPLRINVFIVSSLCGGTGSGMFLDTAYVIQQLLGANRDYATIIGILFFPGFYRSANPEPLRANTWASMRELNYFMTTDPDEKKFSEIEYLPGEEYIKRVSCTGKPFDQVYLIDNQLEGGRKILGIDAGVKAVVEAIGLLITSRIGDDVHSRIADISALRNYKEGTVYSSLAVSSLVLPMYEIHQWISNKLVHDFLEDILEKQLDPTLTPDPEVERITSLLEYEQIFNNVASMEGKSILPTLSEQREFRPAVIEGISRDNFLPTISGNLMRFKRRFEPGFRKILEDKVDEELKNIERELDSLVGEILGDPGKGLKYLDLFYKTLIENLEERLPKIEDRKSQLVEEKNKLEGSLKAAENMVKESLSRGGLARIFGGDRFESARNNYMTILGKLIDAEYRILVTDAVIKIHKEIISLLEKRITQLDGFVGKLEYLKKEKLLNNMEEAVEDILSMDPVRERPIIIGPPGREREGLIENLKKIYGNYRKESLKEFVQSFNNPDSPVFVDIINYDQVDKIEKRLLDISRSATSSVWNMRLEEWIKENRENAYKYLDEIFGYASYMFRTQSAEVRAKGIFAEEVVILGLEDAKKSIYTNELKEEAIKLIEKMGVSLVDTSDPYSIVVLRMGHGLRMRDFTEKDEYIGDYKKAIKNTTPVHVFPEFNLNYKSRAKLVRQLTALGFAFGLIEPKLGAFYLTGDDESEEPTLISSNGLFETMWELAHNDDLLKQLIERIRKFIDKNEEETIYNKLSKSSTSLNTNRISDDEEGWLYEILMEETEQLKRNPLMIRKLLDTKI